MNLEARDFFMILFCVVFFVIAYWQGMEIKELKKTVKKIEVLEGMIQRHIEDCHKPKGTGE